MKIESNIEEVQKALKDITMQKGGRFIRQTVHRSLIRGVKSGREAAKKRLKKIMVKPRVPKNNTPNSIVGYLNKGLIPFISSLSTRPVIEGYLLASTDRRNAANYTKKQTLKAHRRATAKLFPMVSKRQGGGKKRAKRKVNIKPLNFTFIRSRKNVILSDAFAAKGQQGGRLLVFRKKSNTKIVSIKGPSIDSMYKGSLEKVTLKVAQKSFEKNLKHDLEFKLSKIEARINKKKNK